MKAETSKPFTRRSAATLLFRSDEARSVISCVEKKPKIRQTKKSHQTRRCHFQTSPAPEKNVPRFVSAIRIAPSSPLGKPSQQLGQPFTGEDPDVSELVGRARIRIFGVAVVEIIAVQDDLIVRVNLRGGDFGFAIVLISDPAVEAVPVFGGGGTIVEFNVEVHGELETAFANYGYVGAIALVLVIFLSAVSWSVPPLQRVGMGVG